MMLTKHTLPGKSWQLKNRNNEYGLYSIFLQANIQFIKSKGQGVIPGIDRATVLGMAFPIPPLAEQKRIVAKLKNYCRCVNG